MVLAVVIFNFNPWAGVVTFVMRLALEIIRPGTMDDGEDEE